MSEPGPEAIDAVIDHLNGTAIRRPTADVESEVADAEHAQRAAKTKARKYDASRRVVPIVPPLLVLLKRV